MGFDLQTTRFIMEAKRRGADFSNVATLGRQNIHITPAAYSREAARFGLDGSPDEVLTIFSRHPYADGMLEAFGATNGVASIDASGYEHATFIADMNKPVDQGLHAKFSTLIDGGTLEHVFNFPQSAENVAKMLVVGGHFISINGANNFAGHGFYQFSPELFFRVFAPENGLEVELMVLAEANDDGAWYQVSDPAIGGGRAQLVNNARTYLMVLARKIADVPMFATTPQQSDYHDAAWHKTAHVEAMGYLKRPLKQRLAEKLLPAAGRTLARRISQASRDHYRSPYLKKIRSF